MFLLNNSLKNLYIRSWWFKLTVHPCNHVYQIFCTFRINELNSYKIWKIIRTNLPHYKNQKDYGCIWNIQRRYQQQFCQLYLQMWRICGLGFIYRQQYTPKGILNLSVEQFIMPDPSTDCFFPSWKTNDFIRPLCILIVFLFECHIDRYMTYFLQALRYNKGFMKQ